ncbi:MAG: hypothetical protein WD873_03995, partial [Candidatus Hydrogenedentales bacterium]
RVAVRNAGRVLIELDQPWVMGRTPPVPVESADIASEIPEEEDEWRERHLAGWEAAGYVNVGTGETFYFVPRAEADKARQAQELVAAQEPSVDAIPAQSLEAVDQGASAPRGIAAWAKHLVVATVGLLLAAIVLKTLVLQ